ncbi:glutathione S-transferase [Mycena vulgaris]|nr:glutathione S-transferase [Mycena vulgaris]
MVLKVYSHGKVGGGSGLVALVVLEKEIPCEHIVLDMNKGDHKSSASLAKQPFGLVPFIDDNGFILYESRAICRYLAEKYAHQGAPLLPTELKAKALFEQAASIEYATFNPPASKVRDEAFHKPRRGLPIDQTALAAAVSEFSAALDVYEVILGNQKFLAGNEITLADLFHLYSAPMMAGLGIDIMSRQGPNVTRWWNDLIQRPTWVKLNQEGIKGIEG